MMQEPPSEWMNEKGGRVFGRVCRVAPRKVSACCCETPKHPVASSAPRFLLQRFADLRFQGQSPPSCSIGRGRLALSPLPPSPGRAVAAVNNSVVSNVFEIITSILFLSHPDFVPKTSKKASRVKSLSRPHFKTSFPFLTPPTSPAYATNFTRTPRPRLPSIAPASIHTDLTSCRLRNCCF